MFLANRFLWFLVKCGRYRSIPGRDNNNTYLDRWYLLFRENDDIKGHENRRRYPFNLFLHQIRESDEPVFHSHPWSWVSIVLKGGYYEHIPLEQHLKANKHKKLNIIGESMKENDFVKWRGPGSISFHKATDYHWIELPKNREALPKHTTSWSLFLHGKRTRPWGFLVNNQEIYWRDYLEQRHKRG